MKWSDLRYVSDIKEGSNAKEAFLADYLPFGCVAVGTSRAPVRASLADRLVSVGRLPPLRRASQAALATDRTSRPASSFPKKYPFQRRRDEFLKNRSLLANSAEQQTDQ